MAGPRGAQQGSRQPLSLQPGIDFDDFGGMVQEGDAGAIPDHAFHYLENVIHSQHKLVSRPGQAKVNTGTPLGSVRIEGIFDAGDIGAAT